MAARKQFLSILTVDEDTKALLERERHREVTEQELAEQRISFAFGNAMATEEITKESVRKTSQSIRIKA